MTAPVLPEPLATYFAAANAANTPKAALCFALDAVVVDEAQPRKGTAEIAAWIAESHAAYDYTATPTAIAETGGVTRVTATVAGNFPGSPIDLDYLFRIQEGKIRHLEIG